MLKNVYWLWHNVVPPEVCDYVVKSTNWDMATDGTIDSDSPLREVTNPIVRITNVVWAENLSIMGCVTHAHIHAANVNADWNFKFDSFEKTQLGRYGVDGHYDWHKDAFAPINGRQRKLSVTVLLNDPSEFEGGEFEFKELEAEQQAVLGKGSIVVFPSFFEHRVKPITKGERFSAVCWASGPAFA